MHLYYLESIHNVLPDQLSEFAESQLNNDQTSFLKIGDHIGSGGYLAGVSSPSYNKYIAYISSNVPNQMVKLEIPDKYWYLFLKRYYNCMINHHINHDRQNVDPLRIKINFAGFIISSYNSVAIIKCYYFNYLLDSFSLNKYYLSILLDISMIDQIWNGPDTKNPIRQRIKSIFGCTKWLAEYNTKWLSKYQKNQAYYLCKKNGIFDNLPTLGTKKWIKASFEGGLYV